ncbi:hypothetical protein GGR53DRAFT_467433 [Hypoxylon sp. FL1150]|nr:hypothetical protein GGR53DRAFT_467433 [Hypoxylon sp. FL1150]
MADRPYRTQTRTFYKPYRREAYSPHSSRSPSQDDTWEASKDRHHARRVELYKKQKRDYHERRIQNLKRRRESEPSSSRASNASSRTIQPYYKANLYKSRDSRRDSDKYVDKYEDRPSSSISETRSIISSCEDIAERQQAMVNYFNSQIRSLQDWYRPMDPRGRVGRMDGKVFGKNMATTWKKSSLLSAYQTGCSLSSLRATDIKRSQEAYCVGTIFSAPFHTASSVEDLNIPFDDPSLTASPYGSIFSKFRKVVVIKLFGGHCFVLPIYTHNGNGLDGKKHIEEFISIRDSDDHYPEPAEGYYSALYAKKDAALEITGMMLLRQLKVS